MKDTYNPVITGEITLHQGEKTLVVPNRVVGSAQGIIAKLLGGDAQFKLSHVGFIYASDGSVTLPTTSSIDTFEDLQGALAIGGIGNMVIVPVAANSIYASSSEHTAHNIVTKQATSDQDRGAHWAAPHYTGDIATSTYRQVVLLSQFYWVGSSIPNYALFSYADIPATVVVADKELGLDWAITCNAGV